MEDYEYVTLTKEQYRHMIYKHEYKINRLENEKAQLEEQLKDWKKVNPKDYSIQVYSNGEIYFYTNEEAVNYYQSELDRSKKEIEKLRLKINNMQNDLRDKVAIINYLKDSINKFKKLSWFSKIKFKF